MKNKTCIISGHSGVGKSTLVNSISPNLRLKTKEISSSHNQGKHTGEHLSSYYFIYRRRNFLDGTREH